MKNLIPALAIAGVATLGIGAVASPVLANGGNSGPENCQHYSWVGGPLNDEVPAPPPGGSWQANTKQEPHLNNPNITWIGEVGTGLHYASRGGSGKADWFYYGCTEPSPSPTPTPSETPTATPTPTTTPTQQGEPTPTPTPSETPSETPSAVPSETPTATPPATTPPSSTPPAAPPAPVDDGATVQQPTITSLPKTGNEGWLAGIGAALAATGAGTMFLVRRFG